MANELSELDELIESDVLEALGEKVAEEDSSTEIDGIMIEDIEPANETTEEQEIVEATLPSEEETNDVLPEEISIEDIEPEITEEHEAVEVQKENVQTVTSTDLASLLSQLLNNKTIEITIKIKD